MRAAFFALLLSAVALPLAAEPPSLPEQYSRPDSAWRPGISEPLMSLNKAFENAAQIQQVKAGKFPWCLEDVRIPGIEAKFGTLFYEYQFRFSRLVRFAPTIQREECVVTVNMKSGKVDFGEIHPKK